MTDITDAGPRLKAMNDRLAELRTAADLADSEYRAEIERLREAIRRLADQDATLSVQGGNVIVTMDATLTDAEREAVEECITFAFPATHQTAATLRGLLERLK